MLNALESRPQHGAAMRQDREQKSQQSVSRPERCVLRGRLKSKHFMGPGSFVVEDGKPSGWNLAAITP